MDAKDGTVQVSKMVNRFEGMSTLRAKEREAAPKSEKAKELEKYLQKYTDSKPAGRDLRVHVLQNDFSGLVQ